MEADVLFTTGKPARGSFVFDERTANVFDDMVSRSVPFYGEIQRMIVELANLYGCSKSNIYDIGCSAGTTIFNLATRMDHEDVKLVGIDASEPMLARARAKNRCHDVLWINGDLNQPFAIENASVVIVNLTLQFVDPAKRESVLATIYDGLNEDGCLILVEKTISEHEQLRAPMEKFYYHYKARNNYSQGEITRKKTALEGILIPHTCEQNLSLLKRSGFSAMDIFFKWYNFCGIIALKNREQQGAPQ